MPKSSSARFVLGWPVSIACLAFAGPARADEPGAVVVHDLDAKTGQAAVPVAHRVDYLDLGPILSLVGGFHHATGIGLEGSWMSYPEGRIPSFGYGAFLQTQLYDGKYAHIAAGAQGAAGPAGLELGLAFRQTDGTYASTFAAQVGGFLSVGYFYFGLRADAQLLAFPTDKPSFGLESAFTFGLKVPITIVGRDPTGYAIQPGGHAW